MKSRILLIGAVLALVLAASALAADVTGKWTAQVPGRQGTSEVTFNFKADGASLTGTMTSQFGESPISEGKINGDEISFAIVRTGPDGSERKILYKGKVTGDEIKFTREFQGGMMGGPGGPGGPGAGQGPGQGPGPGAGAGPAGGPGGMIQSLEFVAKRAQ
jgi:hypothetical protein